MGVWPRMEPHSVDYSSYDDLDDFHPDYEGAFQGYEPSVTLHSSLENEFGGPTDDPGTEVGWFLWGITAEQLPILIGAAAGGLVLLMTMLSLLIWRCCTQNYENEKTYYLQQPGEITDDKHGNRHLMQSCSESVVFLSSKPGANTYQSCLVEKQAESEKGVNGITRSHSAPVKDDDQTRMTTTPKKRPISQPLQFNSSDVSFVPGHPNLQGLSHYLTGIQLPEIPEMTLRSCEGLEQYSQYASSSVLDEVNDKVYPHLNINEVALKTRSLPAWVRARPRPLSTEDDLNELYAKVNFSKKRKNRMRNDSAAAIALNKSRSQFIQFPFMHKDTDSLVDNEALVIYDERTAL